MSESKKHAPRGRIKADPMNRANPVDAKCTATNRQGKRCGKWPIPGGMVCRMHGGAAPQVQAKADERLRALVHPAITRLAELIDQKEFPSVAIAAVKDALDRNLGKAHESLAVSHSGKVDIVSLLRQRYAKHQKPATE
jgi:hypothetical protein